MAYSPYFEEQSNATASLVSSKKDIILTLAFIYLLLNKKIKLTILEIYHSMIDR